MPARNDTAYRSAKPREKPFKLSDGGGLYLLIQPNATKLWRLAYRFDGKQKLLALGQYPVISLAGARIKRDAAKKLLTDGVDPSIERKTERRTAQMSRRNTFKAVAEELMEKFKAEGDAPATMKRSDGCSISASRSLAIGRSSKSRRPRSLRRYARSRSVVGTRRQRGFAAPSAPCSGTRLPQVEPSVIRQSISVAR
jgi:hypothetical protein